MKRINNHIILGALALSTTFVLGSASYADDAPSQTAAPSPQAEDLQSSTANATPPSTAANNDATPSPTDKTTASPPAQELPPIAGPKSQADLDLLHPAFKLTAEQYNRAVDKGIDLSKKGKSLGDILKPFSQQPVGIKGEKGKSHESSVICLDFNGGYNTYESFLAANNYKPTPPHRTDGVYSVVLQFVIQLMSEPKVGAHWYDRNRTAAPDDVNITRVLLTDDKGNVIEALSAKDTGIQTGNEEFSGVKAIPHVDTAQTNSNATANAYDNNGNRANANAYGTSTTTHTWTEYHPWSVTQPYYSAMYQVKFPVFGADGKPLITSDTKMLTLHMVTPNGEKAVTYKLEPPKL